MFGKAASAVALVFAVALAGPALAADRTASAAQNRSLHTEEAEISALPHVNIPLIQAISRAQRYGGGRPIEVDFRVDDGRPVYDAKVYHDGLLWEGRIDANTGELIGSGKTMPLTGLAPPQQAEIRALARAKTTLAQAAGRAEEIAGGRAIDAGVQWRNGSALYEIGIVKNGRIERMPIKATIATADRPKQLLGASTLPRRFAPGVTSLVR